MCCTGHFSTYQVLVPQGTPSEGLSEKEDWVSVELGCNLSGRGTHEQRVTGAFQAAKGKGTESCHLWDPGQVQGSLAGVCHVGLIAIRLVTVANNALPFPASSVESFIGYLVVP